MDWIIKKIFSPSGAAEVFTAKYTNHANGFYAKMQSSDKTCTNSNAKGSGGRLTLLNFRRTIAGVATRKKQLSREEIHALRGKYKLVPNDKPFAEWMADLNREEKELEERKYQRLAAMGKKHS